MSSELLAKPAKQVSSRNLLIIFSLNDVHTLSLTTLCHCETAGRSTGGSAEDARPGHASPDRGGQLGQIEALEAAGAHFFRKQHR